jgi:hypothetical protein
MKPVRECVYRPDVDMETLVSTRVRASLSRLESGLGCPLCGSRERTILFTVAGEH